MDLAKRVLQTLLRLTQDLKKIHPLLLMMLGLVPLFLLIWCLEEKRATLEILSKKIEIFEEKALAAKNLKTTRESLWQQAKRSPPHYLSEVIESLPLLIPEQNRVQALARQYPTHAALQERVAFLQGDKNRIRFVQQDHREGSFFQETEYKMKNTVQMNEDDLRKFLNFVEESAPERPLLLVKDFQLKRLREKADETVYNIEVELIKRCP